MTGSVTGAILAGGKSSRFGRNKALEYIGEERLIDRSVRLIKDVCNPVFVICRKPEDYFGLEANLVADIIPDRGPIMGLYTALLFSPNEWIFLRAVDMPFLERRFADFLIERALLGKADVIIPVRDGEYEPLFACYHVRCIPHVKRAIDGGGGRIIQFFSRVRVDTVPEEVWKTLDPAGKSLININTPQDLEEVLCEFSRSS